MTKVCVVCSGNTKGSHFGVDSCRGCSEFFRRSIVESRKYFCPNAKSCFIHKCLLPSTPAIILSAAKRLCRRCRLDKCIDSGMQISGVSLTQREREKTEISADVFDLHQPSTSSGGIKELHLERVWSNYQEMCLIRAETEKRLDPDGHKTANQSGMLKGMFHATPRICYLFTRAHTPTVVEFIAKSIEGYEELKADERELLLRPFLIYFWWFESVFRVYKKAPKELYTSLFLVTDTSYVDVNRQDKLFDSDNIPQFVVNDLMGLLKKEMTADRQRSTFLMHAMKSHDLEFIALTELLFWNSTVEGCSDELHKKIHKGRARVMLALERYYEKINESEPFVRIGGLLNIQNCILIEVFRCREDMESFKIFDAFDSFDFVYKVIKDI